MSQRSVILSFLLVALIPLSARADEGASNWDFSFKLGVTQGSIVKDQTFVAGQTQPSIGRSLNFGGFPLALELNLDLAKVLTMGAELHFIADPNNSFISETGAALSLALHVFGGARRRVSDYGYATVVHRDRYNLSLLFRLAYSHFSLSDTQGDQANTFDGEAFEPCLGVQYRQDISERGALVFEIYFTASSLPASDTRVRSNRFEGLMGYRFFL